MDTQYVIENSKKGKPLVIEEEDFHCSVLHCIIWLEKTARMIAIGVSGHCFLMCQYLFKNQVFQTIEMSIPDKLWGIESPGYAISTQKDYLFIIGGMIPYIHPGETNANWREDVFTKSDIIYVIDLINMNCLQSKIKCPFDLQKAGQSPIRAVCVNNNERDDLMVFGYVHEFEKNDFESMNIPFNLIKMILKYILIEYIHIFSFLNHWKINIDDIMCEMI